MPGFKPAPTRARSTHVYYQHPFLYDESVTGLPRAKFVEAIQAELPLTKLRESDGAALIGGGYVKPIYLMPIFQKQIAFGSQGYPFRSEFYKGNTRYEKGMCPVVERLHEKEFIAHEMMRPGMSRKDLDDVVEAFHKVYEHRSEIS